MIVKCQRSLSTSLPQPQMLVYNRDRSWQWQGALTEDWRLVFDATANVKNGRLFAFVEWVDRARPPRFLRGLPEQNW